MINKCALCDEKKELKQSHIIPSFVGKWLKKTSPTGYLRQIIKPNKRVQDITKEYLLCNECEQLFSSFEDLFAKKVFYPYVNEELDEWSVAKGNIKEIQYDEWLLKFIASLQWRALVKTEWKKINIDSRVKEKFYKKTSELEKNLKDYLLDNRKDTGVTRHYVIFLQNLAAGKGTLPENISSKVNTYLCRSVDSTIAHSNSGLFLYTKTGPIAVVSAILPESLSNMNDAHIHLRGKLKTAQGLSNSNVNRFIFIDRPNSSMKLYKVSEEQQKKIDKDTLLGVSKNKGVRSVLVGYSDKMMEEGKRMA